MARQMVDLAIPAAVAASDRLNIVVPPRWCHGKLAMRAFKLSFSGELVDIAAGANRWAISLSGASDNVSMAFPPRCVACQSNVLSIGLMISYEDSSCLGHYGATRAQYPDNEDFPDSYQLEAELVTELLDDIGPAILMTHSSSGRPGWLTAVESRR